MRNLGRRLAIRFPYRHRISAGCRMGLDLLNPEILPVVELVVWAALLVVGLPLAVASAVLLLDSEL